MDRQTVMHRNDKQDSELTGLNYNETCLHEHN